MSPPLPDTRIEEAGRRGWSESGEVYANERTWQVIHTLKAIAAEMQKTQAQVALNLVAAKSDRYRADPGSPHDGTP